MIGLNLRFATVISFKFSGLKIYVGSLLSGLYQTYPLSNWWYVWTNKKMFLFTAYYECLSDNPKADWGSDKGLLQGEQGH